MRVSAIFSFMFVALLALGFGAPLKAQTTHAAQKIAVHIFAQTGNTCGPSGGHCTLLSWTASTSAGACSPTATPPCTFSYNVFRGTVAGGESLTPINAAPVTGLTFTDPVTLTSSPQSFFYTVEAVETVGTVAASGANSNEVSDSFPGTPSAPIVSITNH